MSNEEKIEYHGWLRVFFGKNPVRTFWRAIIWAGLTVIVFRFLVSFAWVTGESMDPSYRDGQPIFINRLAYFWRQPARGDIVAIEIIGPRTMYLKRVIGLPGETIKIENGEVFINDAPLPEPYLVSPAPWDLAPIYLSVNDYFVIGDNRRQEISAHTFGRVAVGEVAGAVLWPQPNQ